MINNLTWLLWTDKWRKKKQQRGEEEEGEGGRWKELAACYTYFVASIFFSEMKIIEIDFALSSKIKTHDSCLRRGDAQSQRLPHSEKTTIYSHTHTHSGTHSLAHTLAHSVRQHPRPVHWQLAAIVPIYDSEFGYIFGKFLNSLCASVCVRVRVCASISRSRALKAAYALWTGISVGLQ